MLYDNRGHWWSRLTRALTLGGRWSEMPCFQGLLTHARVPVIISGMSLDVHRCP